jgi:hypothetical protein
MWGKGVKGSRLHRRAPPCTCPLTAFSPGPKHAGPRCMRLASQGSPRATDDKTRHGRQAACSRDRTAADGRGGWAGRAVGNYHRFEGRQSFGIFLPEKRGQVLAGAGQSRREPFRPGTTLPTVHVLGRRTSCRLSLSSAARTAVVICWPTGSLQLRIGLRGSAPRTGGMAVSLDVKKLSMMRTPRMVTAASS